MWLIFAFYPVSEPDHSGSTSARPATALGTSAGATAATAWRAARAAVTPWAINTCAAATAAEWACSPATGSARASRAAAARGGERVVLRVLVADLDSLAISDVNGVLPRSRPGRVDQRHQRLRGLHYLGVYADRRQMFAERLLPFVRSYLVIGKDQLGIRLSHKPALDFRFQTLVGILDGQRGRIFDPRSCSCRERHLDQRDRIHYPPTPVRIVRSSAARRVGNVDRMLQRSARIDQRNRHSPVCRPDPEPVIDGAPAR